MSIPFVKMHGCRNDYVYLDAVTDPAIERRIGARSGGGRPARAWTDLVRRMADRHAGIGSDGVIVVCKPTASAKKAGAHVRMRMFNADGGESEMCGNGVRCVAKFAHDRLKISARPLLVETGAGVLPIDYTLAARRLVTATVNMGMPRFDHAACSIRPAKLLAATQPNHVTVDTGPAQSGRWNGTLVSMGNPHIVFFPDANPGRFDRHADLQRLDLARIGPALETHPAFRRRINVHFVIPRSRGEATMRTWERGSGITQACGTGACAVLAAGVITARLARSVTLHLPGGDLAVRWDQATESIFMTGPAADVFEGRWPEPRAARRLSPPPRGVRR